MNAKAISIVNRVGPCLGSVGETEFEFVGRFSEIWGDDADALAEGEVRGFVVG